MKAPSATYHFGKFTLNTSDRRLFSEGQEIYLRPKTYETLLYLLEHQGHLVKKNELLDNVWGDVEVTENTLSQCIKEARAALGDDVQNPRFLRTVPRLGYEFIAKLGGLNQPTDGEMVEEELRAVRVARTEEESGDLPSESVGANSSGALSSPRRLLPQSAAKKRTVIVRSLAAVAALAIAVSLVVNFSGLRDHLLRRTHAPRIASLAVLPLENLTGDSSQEYFADGMTEELITTLGKIAALRVISRTSVMRYKKTNKSLPEIARELNVDGVIEGSVMRAGNRLRITAQLIQAPTDRHLWAETYDGDLRDVLSLQSAVARAIASEVRTNVTAQEQARLAGRRPVNPEAYDLYLRGTMLADSNNKAAIEALESAVAVDPDFAPAYAALGRAYTVMLFFFEPTEEWKEKAEAAVERALSLDPNLAEAHVSRAMLFFTPEHGWQYEKAIQECRQALALDPNLAEGHVFLATVFDHVGLLDEALQELHTAAAINPTQPDVALFTGWTLMSKGAYREALPFLSIRSFHALDFWELGQKQDAWAEIHELLKADPRETDVVLASVHALLMTDAGDAREVEKRINQRIIKQSENMKPYGHFHHVANIVAEIYAQLNKPEPAVAWLQKTSDTGFPCYPFFEHDRALDPIRQDPRFIAFMQKLKPQWEYLMSAYGSNSTGLNRNSR